MAFLICSFLRECIYLTHLPVCLCFIRIPIFTRPGVDVFVRINLRFMIRPMRGDVVSGVTGACFWLLVLELHRHT